MRRALSIASRFRIAACCLIVTVAGCAGSGASDEVSSDSVVDVAPPATVGESAGGEEAFTPSDSTADDLGPVPLPVPDVQVSDSVLDPIEPVPDTGVPGLDSDDSFCRSWSEFAGSYQALTFGWAIQGGEAAATLEVVATDALSSSVGQLGETIPAALEAERQALTVDLPAPLLRRAERSRSLLAEAGLDDASIERLGELWLAAVAEQGLESETLSVAINDPALADAVATASRALVEQLPPITEDPSLIVDVQIPETEVYLFENCPDRGTLAGSDNVDTG